MGLHQILSEWDTYTNETNISIVQNFKDEQAN